VALTKAERDAALDTLEELFLEYIESEQQRLLTEYNFLQAIKENHGIEGSAARRSRQLDQAKALISVQDLLPDLNLGA